jgi:hypothetical protein
MKANELQINNFLHAPAPQDFHPAGNPEIK